MSDARTRPTLDDIRGWAPTVSADQAGLALGKSRRAIYAAIAAGAFPVKTIRVNGRIHVVTASLVELLEPSSAAAG